MSFRFTDEKKIEALHQAGLESRPRRWVPSWACPCCDNKAITKIGREFLPPKGVSNTRFDKRIKKILEEAGV